MDESTHTDRIIAQARALIRAIEALDVIERIATQILQAWYRQRLQYLVAAVPRWAGKHVLSASEAISATGSRMPAAGVLEVW